MRDRLYVREHYVAVDTIACHASTGEEFMIEGRAAVVNLALVRQLFALMHKASAQDRTLAVRYPACPPARGQGCDTLVTFVTDRPGHDRRDTVEPRNLEAGLRFTPRHTLESGLRETVRLYLTPATSPLNP